MTQIKLIIADKKKRDYDKQKNTDSNNLINHFDHNHLCYLRSI